MPQSELESRDYNLIIGFLALLTPLILYLNRFADDNRLTSWKWVYQDVNLPVFFISFVMAIALAYAFSRRSILKISTPRKPFVLFALSFLLASLFWQEPEVIIDTVRYFSQAKHLSQYGIKSFFSQWGYSIFTWTDLPLVSFLYGLIFTVFGESRIAIQVLTTFFYSATVVVTYLLGKTLWDEEVGWSAGLLLLGFPYLYTQTPLMLADIPTMFFVLLSIYTFLLAVTKGGSWRIILAAAAFFCAFYAKYSAWVLLTSLAIISLTHLKPAAIPTLKRSFAVALLALLLISILGLYHFEIMQNQIDFLIQYQKPGLKRWSESLASTFLFQIHPFISAGAVYSVFTAARKKDLRYAVICYLVILLLFIMQLKRIRYTLPLFPMVALMASYGLKYINLKDCKNFLVLCIINSSLVIALAGFLPFLKSMSVSNIQETAAFIDTLEAETVGVYTLTAERPLINPAVYIPLLDYHANKEIYSLGGTDPGVTLQQVEKSSLRFTWEYSLPSPYMDHAVARRYDALVILSDSTDPEIPEGIIPSLSSYTYSRSFTKDSGIFRSKTISHIYY